MVLNNPSSILFFPHRIEIEVQSKGRKSLAGDVHNVPLVTDFCGPIAVAVAVTAVILVDALTGKEVEA